LGFNHALTGSIIAVITPAPLVPLVAFASHYLFDLVPHYGKDPRLEKKKNLRLLIAIDGLLCIAVFAFAVWLFPAHWFIIGIGAFFAILPDLFWIFLRSRISKSFDTFLDWADKIQWGERPYGWIYDLVYGVIFALILARIAGLF